MTTFHPISNRLTQLLVDHKINFERFEHHAVVTSEEAALIRPNFTKNQGAKALIVKLTPKSNEPYFVMLVIPGDSRFSEDRVLDLTLSESIRFATPQELDYLTRGVERGGVPPFGKLFNLITFVDAKVLENEKIIFNAGDRRVSIAMKVADYILLADPEIVDICVS